MSGTIYDEIKKNGDSKKKVKLKFFATIFLSNLLVALLCISFGENSTAKTTAKIPARRLHPNFQMIVVPLSILIDIDPTLTEIPVTLMTKEKNVLIEKAYLHEEVSASGQELGANRRFKIEIPESEIIKISADPEVEMIAIPKLNLPPKEKTPSNKRVSHYEIDL